MSGFLEKRRMRKELKEYLNAARHARNMREDISAPEDLEALAQAEAAVRSIREEGGADKEIKAAVKVLQDATEKIYPSSNRSGMRENVEVVIVAIGAAMAIRAFFFQPYKIPTGSMQPTLNGIKVEAQAAPTAMDRLPFKFFKWVATGTSYKEVRAKYSGDLKPYGTHRVTKEPIYAVSVSRTKAVVNIAGKPQKFPIYMMDLVNQSVNENGITHVEKGDVIARGKVITGDHILVNKMKYNFMQPERGDIAVFDTRSIDYPGISKEDFYIKRMVGLPGDKIQIKDNHYLMANGAVIEDPPVFKMINENPLYAGHTFARSEADPRPKLMNATDVLELGENEYLMMGDNTLNSLDGRYFGAVPREDFQGSAFFVYWPFREHWGTVE
ncbi:MAG: signal peptidase I [Pontiellaceae bacterium]|nr:signal peptidase I [Pontiellaceae bacterium]